MKHSIRSLRPLLAPAFALSLFPTLASAQHYQQTNLVSNVPVTPAASVSDPNLQNAWGLVHGPGTPWWISNNAGGTSTLYNTSGLNPANPSGQTPAPVLVPVSIVALNAPGGTPGNGVKVPNAPSQPAPGSPTAVLFNGSTTDFLVAPGKPATFLFATEDGTIQGWNSSVNATTAVIEVDNSQVPNKTNGAVYKGATILEFGGGEYLLAANFRSGRIDVFDSNFKPVRVPDESFSMDGIPAGFAPFNVQGIGPNIYPARRGETRSGRWRGLRFCSGLRWPGQKACTTRTWRLVQCALGSGAGSGRLRSVQPHSIGRQFPGRHHRGLQSVDRPLSWKCPECRRLGNQYRWALGARIWQWRLFRSGKYVVLHRGS
jgi:uncharacterized protein (TIGR03118 family)